MATCSTCGTTILFGGKRVGDHRFCSQKCVARGQHLLMADQVPATRVEELARQILNAPCPECHGAGPVDVHNAYTIWSLVYLTNWKTQPHVACRRCGTRAQAKALVQSVLVGWWGIPYGLILTPVQIVRNIKGLRRLTSPTEPSPELLRLARLTLGAEMAAQARGAAPVSNVLGKA